MNCLAQQHIFILSLFRLRIKYDMIFTSPQQMQIYQHIQD